MLLRHRSPRWIALGVAGLLAFGPLARAQEIPGPPPGTGRMQGKIQRDDGRAPVRGARVVAVHLDSGVEFSSAPSDDRGQFELTGLPYGYFNVGVETDAGMFVANQVINVPPGGKVAVGFSLIPYEDRSASWWSGRDRREGLRPEEPAVGVAEIRTRARGAEFWKSPRGIAVIAGGVGIVLLAIASGSKSDNPPASPSSPAP